MAQKSRNKEMTQVFVTSNAEKVKPGVAVSREGSAEGSRRMQDRRERGAEERGTPEDKRVGNVHQ